MQAISGHIGWYDTVGLNPSAILYRAVLRIDGGRHFIKAVKPDRSNFVARRIVQPFFGLSGRHRSGLADLVQARDYVPDRAYNWHADLLVIDFLRGLPGLVPALLESISLGKNRSFSLKISHKQCPQYCPWPKKNINS